MKNYNWLAAASFLTLAACGGGGGGVNSTPTPPGSPTPSPTPGDTTLGNLRQDHSFTADAATTNVSFNLTSKTTINGVGSPEALTVSYDAGTKSYTLSAQGRSETFAPADMTTTQATDVRYAKLDGAQHDYLTLVTTPYTSATAPKYVGMGYWQQNNVQGTTQQTYFDAFTYGFQSAASAVPRSGNASFGVDAFGIATTPGYEPRSFEGHGTFDVDFLSGVFSTNTYLTEQGLITGDGVTGGGIQLTGAGHLSSGNSFSGNILYGGFNASLGGTIAGHFYGPQAQELGASFSASNSDGSTVAGAMTGSLDPTNPAVNQTLTNMVTTQLFYTHEALLSVDYIPGGTNQAWTYSMISQFNDQTSGNFTYGPGMSNLVGGAWTTTAQVPSSDPNFVSYDKTFNGQEAHLDLYKPGPQNSELALTYLTFGRWQATEPNGGPNTQVDKVFFVYGLETPAGLLSARTGSGHYAGVVYGAGATNDGSTLYDLSGTSKFDVDFSRQHYAGALAIKGAASGGGVTDFGQFAFDGNLAAYGAETTVDLMHGGQNAGQLNTRFYGPDGEEIGGQFTASVVDGAGVGTQLAGVTVAKRQ
ncbi:MAG: transferrin-binding protein-like solute binding protein [Sphingomonas sp.]